MITRKDFIEKLAPYAIEDMKKTNIAASLTIAQAILESASGNSSLAIKANNLFGIKGFGPAGTITMLTSEVVQGKTIMTNAEFRVYNNWGESVLDHSNLILNGVSWNRSLYKEVIGKDGITAAQEIAKAGYATDPDYAHKLIRIIQSENLLQYDYKVTHETQYIETVKKLEARINMLENKCLEIEPPEWFLNEFPDAVELLHEKSGTYNFWRSFAVTLRVIKENNIKSLDKNTL